MTTEQTSAARPRLVTRALLLRFVSIVGSATSFYLLLSVVPLYAQSSGAGGSAAGLVTGALMLTTVAGELATPRLLARFGYRWVAGAGLVLLGVPSLALIPSANMAMITAVCLVRGLGFAVITVAGGALTASLIPPERRGEGLALVGVVAGVPALIALPLGVWMAEHVGFAPVFVAGAVAALVAVAVVPCLPDVERPSRAPGARRADGVVAGLRTPALVRPSLVFGTTAMAAGIVVTFLPLAGASGGVVALALFVQSAASTAARWLAGRHGDRHGSASLLTPGLVASAAGILLLALGGLAPLAGTVAVLAGSALFGAGFGVSQNASLAVMYQRVSRSGYGTVSALWNTAYDAGMGVGATGFGVLAAGTGNPAAFGLTAVLMLAALAPAARDRATTRRPQPAAPVVTTA
jgi:predicted MFS family arabinose efflux permease